MSTKLALVRTDRDQLYIQAADGDELLGLYDLDGEGPLSLGNQTWTHVEGIDEQSYSEDDTDTFWTGQQALLKAAKAAGVELPDYAEIY